MKYRVEHESAHRLRVRLLTGKSGGITSAQEEVLMFAFSALRGVKKVDFYPATGGVVFSFCDGSERETVEVRLGVLERLDRFDFKNVTMLARELENHPAIDIEEMRERKLSPELKRKIRTRMAIEAVADVFLPMPLQLAYHVYQMITLREF